MYILTTGPEGQAVELTWDAWDHVRERHPDMAERLVDLLQTIEQPEHREPDVRPGRERLFRRVGPAQWMRVVLEFNLDFDRVVTAFLQSNEPGKRRSR
ncbi:MAG TPA: hypothetical protein VFU04_02735 [Solirubrobacterales bacterium]|nr:hypothetical protein [Solirubrobacterales bacterium]